MRRNITLLFALLSMTLAFGQGKYGKYLSSKKLAMVYKSVKDADKEDFYQQYYWLVKAEQLKTYPHLKEIKPKVLYEFVKKVRELVEANFTNYEFSVEQLCKLIFMSHSQLHRKLEALTGCSPNKFIRIIRLNKAKELLANPSLSIATIALDCGYNDPGYFARVFKQEFGVTPQDWRVTINK